MTDISIYNGLQFEYSLGANVLIISLIDNSSDKSILTSSNITKLMIEYSYNSKTYVFSKNLSFHINSMIGIIDKLPANTPIEFTPYIQYFSADGEEIYRIKLTNTIKEKTLPYGNITYEVISSATPTNDIVVENRIKDILNYINGIGTYVDETYDQYAQYAKVIPIKYNKDIQTAQATYYKAESNGYHGFVQTSGGSYCDNSTIFHELRHRYGIYPNYGGSHLSRDQKDGRSDLYSYIEDKFKVIHDAQKFETGRSDAKVWIFDAHSNILEGEYTDDGVNNYFAANFIKALVWYTCHSTEDEDTSKIRIIVPLNIVLLYEKITIEEDIEEIKENTIKYNNEKSSKIINIGPYRYLCEYYKNGEGFVDNIVNNFVILRNFEIINDIVYDKDIFFIDSNIYEEVCEEFKSNGKSKKSTEKICFPIVKNNKVTFSNTQEIFSNYSFSNLEDISYKIFKDCDGSTEEANIKCDLIRIYAPVIKKDLKFIIYIDNYINNIHFHYFCNINDNFNKKCEQEIKIGNDKYIEYIEIKVPSIDSLFNNEYYIIDDYNIIVDTDAQSVKEYYTSENNESLSNKMYLKKFILPYIIKDNKKVFINNNDFTYNLNYMNKNIVKITIYPYSDILNNFYVNSDIYPIITFINNEKYLRLHSELGFDSNSISILNTFEFPGKIVRDDEYYDESIYGKYDPDKDEEYEYKDKYFNQVTEYYNTYYLNENIQYLEEKEDIDPDIDIENLRTTGYHIQIANDLNFNDIIFDSVINTDNNDDNFIYDFSFSLDNIVNSWSQLNEILIARTRFIDKRLNVVITGNNVVLTKEWFKYLINNINTDHVLFNKQNDLSLINTINNETNNKTKWNFMDFSQGFNFIDKINCFVTENKNEKKELQIQNQNTQIIYKHVFYKAQDLQNIKIKENMIQNIGVNLNDYMNKVKKFILNINGNNIKESSRNDIYVIFKINANLITDYIGTYNILDENFEYISSGNYTLY